MRRLFQTILILSLLCGLEGCFGPDYGPTYGYPTAGYSPYSYGLPIYASGYAPVFLVHHPWEEHHEVGHQHIFFHGPPPAPHPAAPHVGGAAAHPGWTHDNSHH